MKPGRELDLLIAEKLFKNKKLVDDYKKEQELMSKYKWDDPVVSDTGILLWELQAKYDATFKESILPNYSENMADAWLVVEKLQKYNPFWQSEAFMYFDLSPAVDLSDNGKPNWYANFGDSTTGAYGDTAPHAICLAALEVCQAN